MLGSCARLLITSSVIPSARYSLSAPMSLANGNTATDVMLDLFVLIQKKVAAAASSGITIATAAHSFQRERDFPVAAGSATAMPLPETDGTNTEDTPLRFFPESSSRFSRFRSARISD